VCSVVLLPFLTWLAAATYSTVVRLAIAVGSNINAILFANTAVVIAATAELPLLLQALLLPLPLLLCGELFQYIYCCKYRICQHHCYCYHSRCNHWAAVVAACRHYHCGGNRHKSSMLHFLFYFALAMTMVRVTEKAMATTTAMGTGMIYHHLFHGSNEVIVAIIYFSFYI
jgi:hypothetical protein